ncbi:MAG: DUF2953 domain-containing protein [Bacillota bacterium]|nr:DUF2953 domain-containing protein [Bacillota bacterium]
MMIYIIVLLLFLVSSFFIRIECKLVILDEARRQELKLTFALLLRKTRLFTFNKELDFNDSRFNLVELLVLELLDNRKKTADQEKPVSKLSFIPFSKMKTIPPYVPRLHDISGLIKRLFRYTIIEELDWKSRAGCEDAMMTAISTGFLWALKGSVLGPLSSQCRVKKVSLNVSTDYVNPMFFSTLTCILKIRIVHIIIIAVCAIVLIVRWWVNGFTAGKIQPSH